MKKKFKIFISVLCIAIVMAVPIVALAKQYEYLDRGEAGHEVVTYNILDFGWTWEPVNIEIYMEEHTLSSWYWTEYDWHEGTTHYYEYERTCGLCGYSEIEIVEGRCVGCKHILPY